MGVDPVFPPPKLQPAKIKVTTKEAVKAIFMQRQQSTTPTGKGERGRVGEGFKLSAALALLPAEKLVRGGLDEEDRYPGVTLRGSKEESANWESKEK
ncbi:hypothetical protein TrVE_jg4403 [Triparma verrucosa]|uniref:Uncharacterized protein n=1 Tax=Triparma verrucosa TaxID=1606542 RepID=A0A9W7KSJ9_9STRA|nr:hypothetical protein TrVE_jg4403 [Triparma verrucosa]